MVEDLERGIKLLELTVIQDSYPIRQGHRFELIMGDDDSRKSLFGMKTFDFCPHPYPQRCVEVAQRLIEQKDCRSPDQGSRDVDPLLLSAAQRCRFQIEQIFDLHVFGDFAHPFFDLVSR